MVGKTRPYAQIIQLTMPIAQLPIPNFIFHMALALILVYLQLKVWGLRCLISRPVASQFHVAGRGGFTRLFVLGNYGW
jgi:hypothetical protein